MSLLYIGDPDAQIPGWSSDYVKLNEILAGAGTAWTFAHAPGSIAAVALYVQEYTNGPFVRLPSSAIVSITGVNMVTAAPWNAGALMADYRY